MSDTTIGSSTTITRQLDSQWRTWLNVWCVLVVLFGLLLSGAAFPATDGPTRALLSLMGNVELPTLDRPLRFAVALMGAVTLGWGLTIAAAVPALERQTGPDRRRGWRAITAAVATWFVVDSGLSIATGFALNAVSNLALMIGFVVPLVAGRALSD